ncbi:MATE transporter [Amylocarpus encephaloides]|uniref:MATE transporter n=1 Tax=Amylocarpus encephaloides TaxID=45428 RepID=A0A9P7YRQ5_9HELO|nr:MATE transporter [Amylocarpus encephaloides]
MSTPARPIGGHSSSQHYSIARSPFSGSYPSSSPIAQESLARDLAECSDDQEEALEDEGNDSDDESSEASTVRLSDRQHSMSSSYRRPSFVAFGGARPAITPHPAETTYLSKKEKKQSRDEERSLLRDNHLAPPKHPAPPKRSAFGKLYKRIFSPRRPVKQGDPEEPSEVPSFTTVPSETSLLLPDGAGESHRTQHERLNRQWEEAVAAGKIKTTWQRESKTIVGYAGPLVITFLLQYSLTVASIFTVGHLGTIELGAVSLASMTANITGYAIYQGLATSLDTLCAQAYGSGKRHLVGLQLQRMVYFLWALTIPIGIVWLSAEKILERLVPEKRSAELAGLYLRVLLIGAPGYSLFEAGKRFVQAQGLFSATTYVLLIGAPLNAFMNWLFVWHFGWGFIGAPIAVAITDNLLPLLLFLYVKFVDGHQCWNGFTKKAFHNWGPMIKLAVPGLIMVEAEFLAFEILTLASSYFSTTHLAAQSVLATITGITFQIPFPISIAASTRVANLIGATLSDAAKTSAKVAFIIASGVGIFNVILLSSLRHYIPQLFTNDEEVIKLVAAVLPICAAFQLFDALAANANGLLRGLGRQEIGGYVNIFCYYVIAMPLSFGTAFGLNWELEGLWSGVALALGLVAGIEAWFLVRTSWEDAVEAAKSRNNAG